jgi:enoyl-CoA hydratase
MDTVQVERQERTLIITLNRPEARNAINRAAAEGVAAALDELDADTDLTVAVLTGAGGTFSSGMDLKAFLTGERPEIEGRGLAGLTRTPPRKPIVAAVEGYAFAGGCELVLGCDLVVAADNASFGLPEVKRGLIAGSGGLLRLPRRIPPSVAMEYALTGEPMTAADAHRWGLVNRLTAPGEALPEALRLASQIAANGPLSVQVTKLLITEAANAGGEDLWRRQDALLETVLASSDAKEGAAAFVEKRAPVWRGE